MIVEHKHELAYTEWIFKNQMKNQHQFSYDVCLCNYIRIIEWKEDKEDYSNEITSYHSMKSELVLDWFNPGNNYEVLIDNFTKIIHDRVDEYMKMMVDYYHGANSLLLTIPQLRALVKKRFREINSQLISLTSTERNQLIQAKKKFEKYSLGEALAVEYRSYDLDLWISYNHFE